jgi:hypothetical protein
MGWADNKFNRKSPPLYKRKFSRLCNAYTTMPEGMYDTCTMVGP